ncbi:MAG: cob(I)yrinic acid a,c-diamide adenosyltransferase [Negativicutes bacterium]|nr:cob(I)yrinic acid a,c-diamide adenosyltransferase [Negativicutes bacterium]
MKQAVGLVTIFTGDGKGKTTAAIGVAVRAALNRQYAAVTQFLKGGGYTGELFAAAYLEPFFTIRQFGYGCPIAADIRSGEQKCDKCGLCFRENRKMENGYAQQALRYARELLAGRAPDVLVLDEVSHALRHKLIEEADIVDLIMSRPRHTSIVLTGRQMPASLLAMADIITECQAVKHPIRQGIDARRGVEY